MPSLKMTASKREEKERDPKLLEWNGIPQSLNLWAQCSNT